MPQPAAHPPDLLDLRPLGAFEVTIDLYMERNPVQFSLVAELPEPVSPGALRDALGGLQRQHPLLSAAIDRSRPAPSFTVSDRELPVDVAANGTPWEAVVAHEQQSPIDTSHGPLARATLIPGQEDAAIVLTFAHQIADGVGVLQTLTDLVALLRGSDPRPGEVPASMEDLVAAVEVPPAPEQPSAAQPDPRMLVPGELEPFSGRRPYVDAIEIGTELTARLLETCRAHRTTVHAALCAAAATVFHGRGRETVRILSPIDLRRPLGLPAEVAVRFVGSRTMSEAAEVDDFWGLARRTGEELSQQRTPAALHAAVDALAGHPPEGPRDAEAMMAAATAADIQITNLGALADTSPIVAIWGPAQITQMRTEHVLGAVTSGGRLRMTDLTHDPVPGLVAEIAAVLARACAP